MMTTTRRILVISGFFPFPVTNGFTMRVSALLEALTAAGARIHLLSFGPPSEIDHNNELANEVCDRVDVIPHTLISVSDANDYFGRLRKLPSSIPHSVARFRSQQMQERIAVLLKTEAYDAILCESPYVLVNLPEVLPAPLIIDSHNVESRLLQRYLPLEKNPLKRSYASLEGRKMAAWESKWFSRCAFALACSEYDRSAIKQMCPALPVFVVPNTIDTTTYTPSPSGDPSTVLYLGGMDWFPNRDAVEYFVSRILPSVRCSVPDVKFVIAGRSPSTKFRRRFDGVAGVEFTGTLPDLRPAIGAATVVVVPLRVGSGTRFKILEASAMGKPIVSTSLGAEGLDFADGAEIVLTDDPGRFAEAVAALLKDPNRCRQLGLAARKRVERDYSYSVLERCVRNVLDQVDAVRLAGVLDAVSKRAADEVRS